MLEDLQPGDPLQVGPYRMLKRLGSGGMGRVFLGQSRGGRLVAVKVIHDYLSQDREFRARFSQEVAAAGKVSGVFTAPVVDSDVSGPQPWLATAYVRGAPLDEAVAVSGPLPVDAVAGLAAGLAEGIAAIHAAGVVHRDLKPSNVLLAEDGPRVIDFGISRAAEFSALTQTGMVVGSPGYMAPEQAEGREAGTAADVFSLGAVLVFAATGTGPFGSGPAPALLYRVVHGQPDLGAVPAGLRSLAARCLAKDPAERPELSGILAELSAAWPDRVLPQDHLPRGSGHLDTEVTLAARIAAPSLPQPSGSKAAADPPTRTSVARPVLAGQPAAAAETVSPPAPPGVPSVAQVPAPKRRGRAVLITGLAVLLSAAAILAFATRPPLAGSRITARLGGTLPGTGFIASAAFSPDGKILATTYLSASSKVYLWDAASRTRIATLTIPSPGANVLSLAFSSHGTIFATGDDRGTTYLWNTRRHNLIVALADEPPADGDMVDSVTFSPDGKILAVGDSNGKTYLWDMASHAKIAALPACSPPQKLANPGNGALVPVAVPVDTVVFSPDGKTLAVGDGGGRTCLWNAASRTRITTVIPSASTAGVGAAYSPDGKILAIGDFDGEIYLWDTVRRTVTGTIGGPSSQGSEIAFAPDGKILAIGYGNGVTYLWNLAVHAKITTLTSRAARSVSCLAFSPDGKTLAICVHAGKVDLWQISN